MIFMAPAQEINESTQYYSSANHKLMQNFLWRDDRTLLKAAAPGNAAELHIGQDFHGFYDYIFTKKEFVISPADRKVRFFLKSNLKNHAFMIRDHCCTRPDRLTGVKITQPGTNPGEIAEIEFDFQYEAGLLILIGLFITATDLNTGATETILCDPQVGSGPP